MPSFIGALRACELSSLADEVDRVYQSNLLREPPTLALLLELLSDSLASTLPLLSPHTYCLHLSPSLPSLLGSGQT